jgi:ubiquinone/menaquinone biosynthesis C-methylase UbiE
VDFSTNLLEKGRCRYPQLRTKLLEGDACQLPFRDGSFDVAMMIGILHHLGSCNEQKSAIKEALRVLKKSGLLVIRECNTLNPLFRMYWNYVFPLTAKIDKFGGENWISVKFLSDSFRDSMEKTMYFTFIPNILPRSLLPIATRIEQFLTKSPLCNLSAHYIAILRNNFDS